MMDKRLRTLAEAFSLVLLLGGCGQTATAVATRITPLAIVQIIQGPYGLQASIPPAWMHRTWLTGAGGNLVEGTNAGHITSTTWAVPQKVGVTKIAFQGNYIITKTFSRHFSAEIAVPNTATNRVLAERILKSLKLYHLKRGAI